MIYNNKDSINLLPRKKLLVNSKDIKPKEIGYRYSSRHVDYFSKNALTITKSSLAASVTLFVVYFIAVNFN